MSPKLLELVRDRAQGRCEYCRLPQAFAAMTASHIEHIVAKQHGGEAVDRNLAYACSPCNLSKGPNLTGVDPKTGVVTQLFNPRRHKWTRHFYWKGALLIGRTALGRATIEVLGINKPRRLALRQSLFDEGVAF